MENMSFETVAVFLLIANLAVSIATGLLIIFNLK